MTTTGWPPGSDTAAPRNIAALFDRQARRLGDQPLLTFYDDGTGERTELSYATFLNWTCKTANLLSEELGARRGGGLVLHVTRHWTGLVVAAAAWRVGAVLQLHGQPRDSDILVVGEASLSDLHAAHHRLLVVGGGPGGRLTAPAPGVAYGDEVLAHDDDHDDPAVRLDDPAVAGPPTMSQRDMLDAAAGALAAGDRVMTTASLDQPAGLILGLVAPVAAGASTVWCPRPGRADLLTRAADERTSHLLDAGALRPW